MSSANNERAVAIARAWIGTPYHHQASLKGVGCDCLGLVRGIWREIYGADVTVPANYTADWAEASGDEAMLVGAKSYLTPIEQTSVRPGDILIFRLRRNTVAKHTGIAASDTTFIHAMEGGPVCEVTLSPWWQRRIAGTFRFPEVINA